MVLTKETLTDERALQYLATRIWTSGESKAIGSFCLVPFEYVPKCEEFNLVSSYLHKLFKATHYDLTWIQPGKVIRVRLFEAEAFGATRVTESMIVKEVLIEMTYVSS